MFGGVSSTQDLQHHPHCFFRCRQEDWAVGQERQSPAETGNEHWPTGRWRNPLQVHREHHYDSVETGKVHPRKISSYPFRRRQRGLLIYGSVEECAVYSAWRMQSQPDGADLSLALAGPMRNRVEPPRVDAKAEADNSQLRVGKFIFCIRQKDGGTYKGYALLNA